MVRLSKDWSSNPLDRKQFKELQFNDKYLQYQHMGPSMIIVAYIMAQNIYIVLC